tara:strand:- start:145 stop:2028 length:1884 start_codon:yes stop_codon:yes gene_type:complete
MASSNSKLVKLNFTPGIRRETTQYAEEGSWYDTDRVRFRAGRPQNIGGYETKVSTTFDGAARDLITWSDNDQFKRAMFGTPQKLYEHNGDTITDITPVSSSVTLLNAFTIALSATTVTVSATAHGRSTGDYVFFTSVSGPSGGVTLGGNIILGTSVFSVSVVSDNVFAIDVATTASAAQSSASQATIHYLLFTGVSGAATGFGYGAAGWLAGTSTAGARAYSEPASADSTNFETEITQWSLDNWGEDVIANRRKGSIYVWDADASTTPIRAALVSGATDSTPTTVDSIVVSPNDRHLIALGANQFNTTASPTGTYDPMIVRWAHQEDYTNWVPSVSSTSGEVQLADGTAIIGGVRSRNAVNIWTDNSLWLQTFVGPPFTFKFSQMGTNCGLIAPHASIDYDGRTVWMGFDNFYTFDGQVRTLDCTVRRYIFDRLDLDNKDKIFTGINSEFKEVIWLYPSTDGSGECDSYVIWSPDENYWTYGSTLFTTFNDKIVFGNTITTGVSVNGNNIYNNEPDGIFTANGEAITSFIESADFDIEDGTQLMFLDRLIPDMTLNDGTIKFSITTKQFPESTQETEKGPFSITKSTNKIDLRARGRQGRVRVSCNSADTSWRWGSVRLSMQQDGRR